MSKPYIPALANPRSQNPLYYFKNDLAVRDDVMKEWFKTTKFNFEIISYPTVATGLVCIAFDNDYEKSLFEIYFGVT